MIQDFQSHFGLILSCPRWLYDLWNFRLSIPFWSDFIWRVWDDRVTKTYDFQSHYGLILSAPATLCPLKGRSFQSHYGLILSQCFQKRAGGSSNLSFNPTMVWFYRFLSLEPIITTTRFQSHYGLILSGRVGGEGYCTYKTFNPTMVWFYPAPAVLEHIFWYKLSIPLWSDFITHKHSAPAMKI